MEFIPIIMCSPKRICITIPLYTEIFTNKHYINLALFRRQGAFNNHGVTAASPIMVTINAFSRLKLTPIKIRPNRALRFF